MKIGTRVAFHICIRLQEVFMFAGGAGGSSATRLQKTQTQSLESLGSARSTQLALLNSDTPAL